MQIIYSQTSSKGNCSVIKSKKGALLIIDCGIQYKKVDKGIGYCLHGSEALLITHAHKDHTAYINDFISSGIHTYIGEETFEKINISANINCVSAISLNKTFYTESFSFIPLEMKHANNDGTLCECFGFLIMDKDTGEKMLWATDTQYIKNCFSPLDFYCIECNYIGEEDYFYNIDYFNKPVEKRRLGSHMSLETCIKFLKMQDLSKCKEIRLLHLSHELTDDDKKIIFKKIKKEIHVKGAIIHG